MAVKNLSSRKQRRSASGFVIYRSSKFSRLPLPIRALIGVALSLSGFLCFSIVLSLVVRALGGEQGTPFWEGVLYAFLGLMSFLFAGFLMQFLFGGSKRKR